MYRMAFKIVQTTEEAETCLSIVPSTWEDNGILKWPNKPKLAEKLSHKENSQPYSTWDKLICIKKREFQKRKKEAENEVRLMEAHSDTEKESENNSASVQNQKLYTCYSNEIYFPFL